MLAPMRIKVAIAEDHRLVREGLKALLTADGTLELVGEASDGLQAVETVERQKPDVLLLDLRMPRLHGLEVIRQIKPNKTKVVIVSMHSDEPYLVEAVKCGVRGYVLKDSPPAELIQAIKAVAAGGSFFSKPLREKMDELKPWQEKANTKGSPPGNVTKRERLVLELAAEGKSNAQIAEDLFISKRTAEAHRASVMKKLGLKSQTDLVLYAVRNGIVKP
jgi:DNA-binding NarL/FixJ family response regulator